MDPCLSRPTLLYSYVSRMPGRCNKSAIRTSSMVKRLFTEKFLLYQVQAQKSPDAFGELYDRYINKIYRFIYLKLSDKEEAEDTTSDVFLKAWNYLIDPTHPTIQSFSGLMYKMARNAVIDVYRKRANRQEFSLNIAEEIPDIDDGLGVIHARHEHELILKKLKTLKNEYQEVIVLRYIDDLSIMEIAEILGKKQTAVRVTIHRALGILKKMLDSHE